MGASTLRWGMGRSRQGRGTQDSSLGCEVEAVAVFGGYGQQARPKLDDALCCDVRSGAGQDLYQGVEGLLLMVLGDDLRQQLVLALGQLDEGADAVDVGVGLHVQHVVSPWGDGSVAERPVAGQPSPCYGGTGLPSSWPVAQTGSRWGGGTLLGQKAEDAGGPTGFEGQSPAFLLASLSAPPRTGTGGGGDADKRTRREAS